MIAPAWVAEVQALWEPRERLGGNAWAERERYLSPSESGARSGRWRSIPWQVEILDALADPTVNEIVIQKATQIGVSELIRCAIGRWALLDPGDVLWVMTTETAAKKAMKKLQEMFRSTPALRKLLSPRKRDTTLLELVLTNGMKVVIGWAGSAQSMSSDPFPRVVADEVAKYGWEVNDSGNPVDVLRGRTKTFGRRAKVVLLSSPQDDDDQICTAARETLDRRAFGAPCPACGTVQPFEWGRVRWPGGDPARAPQDPAERVALAEHVLLAQTAWLECERAGCGGQIQPGRAQYSPGARWLQESSSPGSRRRAYHVPEAWHWETTISDLVARWLRATHPKGMANFHLEALARPYRTDQTPITAAMIESRATHPAGVVPAWATVVLATADTQLAGWWLMIRAWGPGGRSRLLDWGWVETEEELVARGLLGAFPVEGGALQAAPLALGVDTGGGMKTEAADGSDADGSRTKQVYALVRRHAPRMFALKGEGDKPALDGAPRRVSQVGGGLVAGLHVPGIDLHLVNKNFYADVLATLVRDPTRWEECVGAEEPTYVRQMSSEQRVLVTTARGSRWLWQKRTAGTPNHLWDCARYQCWLADLLQVEHRRTAAWLPRTADARPELTRRIRREY